VIDRAPESKQKLTFSEALLYCHFCNHDGYTDWRLPVGKFECWLFEKRYWRAEDAFEPEYLKLHVVPVRDV
jgi:hypothetical protein